MKDSKIYSKNLKKFYRLVKQKYPKVKNVSYDDITKAIVHGIILEKISESAKKSALKKFDDYFIDLNDMRVSRPEEIIEMLGENTPEAKETAMKLIEVLKSVFHRYDTINLETMKKMGKKQAKQILEKFEDNSRFAVDYCVLTALGGHAIPLTSTMTEYLKGNELVHPQAKQQEIEGFLTRQISAKNAYEFYSLLRQESETGKVSKAKKKKAGRRSGSETKTKTAKKAAKKKK